MAYLNTIVLAITWAMVGYTWYILYTERRKYSYLQQQIAYLRAENERLTGRLFVAREVN